jgi:hypothetical protein
MHLIPGDHRSAPVFGPCESGERNGWRSAAVFGWQIPNMRA